MDVVSRVANSSAGGTVVFIGTVRDRNAGRKVDELEYEAYAEMADSKIREIEREVRRRWPIRKLAVVHRRGKLKVGETSVVVAVSSEHRAEAFEAARYAIEALKRTVPIWKRESTSEKQTSWVGGVTIQGLEEFNRRTRTQGITRRRPSRQRSDA